MDNRRWWDVRSRLMRAAQRCRTQKGCARTILAFEALEPRILLSADPFGTAPAAGLGEALPSAAIIAPLHERAGEPARIAWTPPVQPNGVQSALPDPTQVVYLDFDGANDIVYRGPVFIQDIDVPAFQANGALRGHEDEVAAGVRDLLEKAFAGTQIDFTLEQPAADSPCSTVFIGGDGAAFAAYGSFYGISERVDEGNRDRSDNAFMFPAALPITACSVSQYAGELAYYIGHEVGHLLGLEHEHAIGEHSDEAAGALSAVAFAPYTHVETALDIRNDVIDDGQVTIAGKQYQVNPLIVEAVSRYPAFYYGGAVGPDGFPDIVQGQSIVHPDSSGVWVGHVLDKAWAAQGAASRYSQEEQLQILAWGYGYAIHAVGDLWSHTLVNEFADGPFPDFANVVTVDLARANALRHIIVEGYIADATPGFDADSDRSRLPDGDVSDNASFPRTLAAPHAFIADALIADLPDLPGQKEERLFSVAASDANLSAVIAALDANAFPEALKTQFIDHHRQLADTLVVTTVKAGQIWTVRSDFDDFVLRRAGTDAAPVLEVSERSESRGVVIDAFLALRERLVALKAALPAPAPGF